MRRANGILTVVVALALATAAGGYAQGQGQGKGKGQDKKAEHAQAGGQKKDAAHPQQQGKGKAAKVNAASDQRGPAMDKGKPGAGPVRAASRGKFTRDLNSSEKRSSVLRFASSKQVRDRVAAGALARALDRGLNDDDVVIIQSGNRLRINNRSGAMLLDIDENRARNLGHWDVKVIDDRVKSGAPAFCRSGAGHPNWGRQWCIDKGFGLGSSNDVRWGRASTIGDIVFGRRLVNNESLVRDALLGLVGNVVLDRLGLHALTLGYTEPLSGTWYTEPAGSQVLLVNSGTYPVAEMVDTNRDGRADVMFFALRPW